MDLIIESILTFSYFFVGFLHVRSLKGRATIQQRVEYDSRGPNIDLIGVAFAI